MTSSTSAASSGPGRLIPAAAPASGRAIIDSARLGSTASCRCPAISQPSDR